ncbi:hypothetical protein KY328_01195 [Candidatus Woesearchaeota archaeon]|nr:hypothetical protein [Candidatus Woesearchaeota archaeon]MBW3021513.1 hypothetical protein [Candidatus Woesearchaeota archaeon]
MKDKLELRKRIKSKKPRFVRQDSHKKVKLGKKWRKPRGSDNKVRIGFKSYRKKVKIGYGSPRDVEGFDPSGVLPVVVSNMLELTSIKDGQGVVFSSRLGVRKKVGLIKKAMQLKLKILNIKDPQKYLTDVEQRFAKKKQDKEKALKEKEAKKKELEKKAKEKEKEAAAEEQQMSEEELAEKAKSEQEKKRKEEEKILRTRK